MSALLKDTSTDALYTPRPVCRATPPHLISAHIGLVRKIAWHVHAKVSKSIEVEDLVQIGMIAMLECAHSYDPARQASFATYSTLRIRGAMIDEVRRQATICRSALRRRRSLIEARETLQRTLGREPEELEVADFLELSPEAYHAARQAAEGVALASIDEVYSDHAIWFVGDEEAADERLERAQLKTMLVERLRDLPEREALVLQLYYSEELNLEEIGAVLGVGAARVCQIKKSALDRLRASFAGSRLAD